MKDTVLLEALSEADVSSIVEAAFARCVKAFPSQSIFTHCVFARARRDAIVDEETLNGGEMEPWPCFSSDPVNSRMTWGLMRSSAPLEI